MTPTAFNLAAIKKAHVCAVLALTAGQATQTAQMLGIGRATLYRFLAKHKIDLAHYRAAGLPRGR